jgi:hypothetical protein
MLIIIFRTISLNRFTGAHKSTIIENRKLIKGGIIMAKARVITYECEECGSEIVVTPTGESELSPIYCCGIEVTEISSAGKKALQPKKKTVKKGTKKTAKKKASPKKKPAAKKKTSKK